MIDKKIEQIKKQLDYIEKLKGWAKDASVADKVYCYEPKIEKALHEIYLITKDV